ncbi:FtsX-like permease family protein [Candidatus Poribacteria bacterium]|nr:FtsX-like permease family protein [Candidatus Poribacteria bacterium]
MWIYIKLAWRNIFRNKRRTIIAATAISIGLAALIFTDALVRGMEENMVHSATASFLGEGQIHAEGFRITHEAELTINNLDSVLSKLKDDKDVKYFTPRTMTFGMITSAANLSSVNVVGILPDTEKHLSQIDDAMTEGEYLSNDNKNSVVIGSKLAEILEVGLGDRVVLTVSQAETSDLSQNMFRVGGIYHFNIKEMDSGMVFVHISKAQEMLALDGGIHEIAVRFNEPGYGRNEKSPFWDKYSQNKNKAVSWTQILPQLEGAFRMFRLSTYITGIILFAAVAFGIVNTLFMSIYERMFEFGVLRAVGTRRTRLGSLIVFEAAFLSIISIILGSLLGLIVTYITTKTGIDYRGIEITGVTVRELLYPVLNTRQFTLYPFWVFVFTTLTGIYPAWHAAKMRPAESMRRSF